MYNLICSAAVGLLRKGEVMKAVSLISKWFALGAGACILSACEIGTYTIGGEVSGLSSQATGLTGGQLVLQNNSSDDKTISQNGPYEFETELDAGESYYVTVHQQPLGHVCSVVNPSGEVSEYDVTNVDVTCVSSPVFVASASGTSQSLNGSWRHCGFDPVVSADKLEIRVITDATQVTIVSFFNSTDSSCSGAELNDPAPASTTTVLDSSDDKLALGWSDGQVMVSPPLGSDGNSLPDAPFVTKIQRYANNGITKLIYFIDDSAVPWRLYGNAPVTVSGCDLDAELFHSCLLVKAFEKQ